jgi:hypothetical protein
MVRAGLPGALALMRKLKGKIVPGLLHWSFRREITIRIDRCLVDAHLVVQMRGRHAARVAHRSYAFALADFLAGNHVEVRKVCVISLEAVAMIHNDQPAVAAIAVGEDYDSIRGGSRRRAESGGNVDARVVSSLTRKGIRARQTAGAIITTAADVKLAWDAATYLYGVAKCSNLVL